METWYFEDRDYIPSKKRTKEPVEPLGPNHPSWKEWLREVEFQLEQSGRVYEEADVLRIAMSDSEYKLLIKDVVANYPVRDAQIKAQIFSSFLSEVRSNAESDLRLDNLFRGKTTTTPQNPF